jgi:hypothetical protein
MLNCRLPVNDFSLCKIWLLFEAVLPTGSEIAFKVVYPVLISAHGRHVDMLFYIVSGTG